MIEIEENDLKYLITDIQEYAIAKLGRSKNSYSELSNLAECFLSLEELLDFNLLVPHEQVILQRSCLKMFNTVWSDSNIFFYSSFYYFDKKVKSGDELKVKLLKNEKYALIGDRYISFCMLRFAFKKV
jgi:hypothetical protein